MGYVVFFFCIRLACGRFFKETLRFRLSLTWDGLRFCPFSPKYLNIEHVGLTISLLSVHITCI
jgi:hypothetical protein